MLQIAPESCPRLLEHFSDDFEGAEYFFYGIESNENLIKRHTFNKYSVYMVSSSYSVPDPVGFWTNLMITRQNCANHFWRPATWPAFWIWDGFKKIVPVTGEKIVPVKFRSVPDDPIEFWLSQTRIISICQLI